MWLFTSSIQQIKLTRDFVYIQHGDAEPKVNCDEKRCMNGGRCVQGWFEVSCDCEHSSFRGERCQEGQWGLYEFDMGSFEVGTEHLRLVWGHNSSK